MAQRLNLPPCGYGSLLSCSRRTSWWFLFVFPRSPLPVVSESAGPSRWAAEAGAKECPSSFVVEAMGEPDVWGAVTWQISLSGIQIGESAPWGKIQACPRPLLSNGSGPLRCAERRFFHLTRGFVLCCSGLQCRSIAVTPNELVFRLFITKRACCRIW